MSFSISRVGVVGAGTMGGGIAALIAGIGVPVVLLDIAPNSLTPEEQAAGLTLDAPQVRNRIVGGLWDRQLKARPAALFTPESANLVTVGNLSDDLGLFSECDWIIEVIIEQLEPKRALMERIDALRKPTAIISTNTSGIPVASIAAGRSESFRRHFLGTHFFNPPRYLKLLEIIPTEETDPQLLAFLREWTERQLGKGVVVCKDRPNFIANRLGAAMGQLRMNTAFERGLSVAEVDALTGPLIGNPSTATFRLMDLVGIDVWGHVVRNLEQNAPDDEMHALFTVHPVVAGLISQGALGNKTGVGFYKRTKGPSGETEFHVLNYQAGQHEAPARVEIELVKQLRGLPDLGSRLRAIMQQGQGDRYGDYLIDTTLPYLAYSARRIPEIADSIADLDNAMRWGFNVEAGPFETWDLLGVRETVAQMQARTIDVAPWVLEMLESGIESFYRYDGAVLSGVYDPQRKQYVAPQRAAEQIVLAELHGGSREVQRNDSASLLDLGEGVLCLEFHSKANSLDQGIFAMGRQALELLERDEWQALVVGNQGENFCVGANLGLFINAFQSGQLASIEVLARELQDLLMDFRFSRKPVVMAPFKRVLGGGTEVMLHGARSVASAESYIGLVEFGVGVIPAGGGCKELLRRVVSPHMARDIDPIPYLQQVFETIAYARVSESAQGAQALGFLDQHDRIVMNEDRLIGYARQTALQLVQAGYTAPSRSNSRVYAVGRRGKAVILTAIEQLLWGRYISEHDALIARKLAHVLAGGDLSAAQWVPEQYILDLEREAFMSLIGEEKTQQRIGHMLKTGKALRN